MSSTNSVLSITKEEYRDRLAKLGVAIERAGLDLFLVTSFDSIYYLTGAGFEPLERPFFLVVFPLNARAPLLLVPRLDQEHLRKAHNIDEVHSYWDYPAPEDRSWPDRLRSLIGTAQKVGVEPSLRLETLHELLDLATEMHPLVEQLRLIKTPTELAMIRRAAKYADQGVTQLLDASYQGASVAEGFARTSVITRKIIKEVDDFEPLTTKVIMATWAAPRSAQPHSVPGLNDRLGGGPHVALVLTRVNGYAAECERTYFTIPPDRETWKAFDAMLEARRRAFTLVRPGMSCADLDQELNDFLRSEGYGSGDQRLHRTGHGFGLGNHEAPWIAEGSKDVLAENMVISIEPGIYIKGTGGVRHSDTVLVTRDGHELLTSSPDDLETLTIRGWRPLTRFKGRLVRRALQVERKSAESA